MFKEVLDKLADWDNFDMPCTACQYYYCNEERGFICMFIGCVYGGRGKDNKVIIDGHIK